MSPLRARLPSPAERENCHMPEKLTKTDLGKNTNSIGLEHVLVTDKLTSRTPKKPDGANENQAFLNLARIMAVAPGELLDALLQAGIELCHAGTAGLSLLETTSEGDQIFRWTNLAGRLKKFIGGWTPRNFSPCGVCLDRDAPQLLTWPARYFYYLKDDVDVPIVEALVIPVYIDGQAPGTIWILSHDEAIKFDSEDVRIMSGLAEFTSSALRLTRALESANKAQKEAESEVAGRRIVEAALTQSEARLEAKVEERTSELRQLSSRLLSLQDEERRRIARDLHDSVGQELTALKLGLSAIAREVEQSHPQLAKLIFENTELAKFISDQLRTISYLLHPPLLDEVGLGSALRWYVEGFEKRSGIKTKLELETNGRLAPEQEIALFRTVQESLTNILRHSGSSTALIRVHQSSDYLTLEVQDEGNGMTQEHSTRITSGAGLSVGLQGMRERIRVLGGNLQISSEGLGLKLTVRIPLSGSVHLQPASKRTLTQSA